MSPTNQACANQLRQQIYYNLDLDMIDNALFIAGRLFAYEPRAAESSYLIALCNFRLHRYKLAYEHSKAVATRSLHLGCGYVFAQACLALGKYQEGIEALTRVRSHWRGRTNYGKHSETRRQSLPDAAAVLCLLGQLYRGSQNLNAASEAFSESLKLNPFMWTAFQALCDMGTTIKTSKVFQVNQDMKDVLGSTEESTDEAGHPDTTTTAMSDPFAIMTSRTNAETRHAKPTLMERLNGAANNIVVTVAPDTFETPPNNGALQKEHQPSDAEGPEPPQAPFRRTRTVLGAGDLGSHAPARPKVSAPRLRKLASESEDGEGPGLGIITDRKRTVSGYAAHTGASSNATNSSIHHNPEPSAPTARRSVRILNSSTSRPQSRVGGNTSSTTARDVRDVKKPKTVGTLRSSRATTATVGRVVSGNRKIDPHDIDAREARASSQQAIRGAPVVVAIGNDKNKELEAVQALLGVFQTLGEGYFLLSQYKCQAAITLFNSLPQAQRDTPWVLSQLGKAYFEQTSWLEAEKVYSRVRVLAPARVEDLEYYSTVLWHLKREVELSFLAHEIMDLDRLSPQAWCIIGNSLSLSRDHDGALKCFKRATQLDPKFAYAFTLQGHEHISSEEYDKALEAYRRAVGTESRHYNAYYGIGRVYEKQGKIEMAETHYRLAHEINPTNAILVCCLGAIMEKLKKVSVALDWYNKAVDMAPKSTLARYRKARALIGIGESKKALTELLVLKDIAPEEANVHFLLGKVYKALRDKANAVKHFTSALNLDPKASQHIKEAMELLEEELEADDMMQ